MLPDFCRDMTSSVVGFFSGCFKLTAAVSPAIPPTLPPEEKSVAPSPIVDQPVSNESSAVPQDSEHPEGERVNAAADRREEVPIHGEIQSDGTTDNGAGAVSSRASTALATEPPAEANRSSSNVVWPDCTLSHLRWLVSNNMYSGPLPEGFTLEDEPEN